MSKTSTGDAYIPLCVPEIGTQEWQYIRECLETNFVSSVGPFVTRFEHMVANYIGATHAVATVNGTSALHIALLVAGIRPDDEVLVSTLTFIAPANTIRYAGAWPVFVDSEPQYWQMDPQKVCDFLEKKCRWQNGELRNRETGRRIKAILPVHILGHSVDMDPIIERARKYNLAIIEDATECLGARYKNRMVGRLGDIACFSFNGNKIITTGGGGMILTDNEDWARKARYLTTQAKDDPIEYIHNEIGYNYRLSNIQAAMGCAQMEQLDGYVEAKRRIATRYTEALKAVPGLTPMGEAQWAYSTFWMYTVRVDPSIYGIGSRDLLHRLDALKIQSRPLWCPIHKTGAHPASQYSGGDVAEDLYRDALSLPCSAGLKESEQDSVIRCMKNLSKKETTCSTIGLNC